MMNKILLKNFKVSDDFFFEIQKCPLTRDFPVHNHDFSELVVILEGSGIHIIDTEEYPVKAGQVYVINEGTSHGYKQVNNLKYFNVIFSMDQLVLSNELKKLSGFQGLFVLEPFYRKEHKFNSKLELTSLKLKRVETILDFVLEEFNSKRSGYKILVQSYMTSLAVLLSREYASSVNDNTERLLKVAEAIAYMERNFSEDITLEKLASLSFMSKRHFVRVFKQNYKLTPIEYIIGLRLKRSCELLGDKSLSILQIALECGFKDANYFSRKFRSFYNITPSEYRSRLIQKPTT